MRTLHRILDYCQNLEYFSQNPATTDGALGESLGKRLFKARLELISELDRPSTDVPPAVADRVAEQRPPTYRASASLRGDL